MNTETRIAAEAAAGGHSEGRAVSPRQQPLSHTLDLSAIRRIADELDAMIGDEDDRLFHDMLVGETDIDRIVLRIHEQIARDNEMLAGITERQASIAERKKRIADRADKAKAFIGKILRAGRLSKLELPEVTYSVRDGKPGLSVVSPDAVPDEFCRFKKEPDKAAINKAFDDVEALPNWLVRSVPGDVVTARTK